jgi:hypothetical protein
MSDRGPRASGASGAGVQQRRPWWLWLLVALVAIAALLFALSRCGGDGDPAAAPGSGDAAPAPTAPESADAAAPAAPSPAAPTGPEPGGAGAGEGGLTVGGAALLPLAGAAGPDGSLAGRVGEQVTASGATVQSVAADEGFWVGTSETDRVWVQLQGGGESDYLVRPGDRVEFDGPLVAHDDAFAAEVGVDPAEGADQLTGQGAHVEVQQSDLSGASR